MAASRGSARPRPGRGRRQALGDPTIDQVPRDGREPRPMTATSRSPAAIEDLVNEGGLLLLGLAALPEATLKELWPAPRRPRPHQADQQLDSAPAPWSGGRGPSRPRQAARSSGRPGRRRHPAGRTISTAARRSSAGHRSFRPWRRPRARPGRRSAAEVAAPWRQPTRPRALIGPLSAACSAVRSAGRVLLPTVVIRLLPGRLDWWRSWASNAGRESMRTAPKTSPDGARKLARPASPRATLP